MKVASKPTSLNITEVSIAASDSNKVFSFLLSENRSDKKNGLQEPSDVINYICNGIPKQAVNLY